MRRKRAPAPRQGRRRPHDFIWCSAAHGCTVCFRMLRRAKRRCLFTAFIAVWMNAQLLPVTLCRLLQPEAPPSVEAHSHADHSETSHSHSTASAHHDGEIPERDAMPDCCDDPLASCCIDSLRTMLLVSRDGMGADGDFLAAPLPSPPTIAVPLLIVARATPARFLGPPPHIPKTTILQI